MKLSVFVMHGQTVQQLFYGGTKRTEILERKRKCNVQFHMKTSYVYRAPGLLPDS